MQTAFWSCATRIGIGDPWRNCQTYWTLGPGAQAWVREHNHASPAAGRSIVRYPPIMVAEILAMHGSSDSPYQVLMLVL